MILPNNLCVAKQRCNGLKRKFEKNKQFHEEYTRFLSDVLEKGYAEKVPEDQLDRDDGKVWYVPHHGVFHPKKGTLRVVLIVEQHLRMHHLTTNCCKVPTLQIHFWEF